MGYDFSRENGGGEDSQCSEDELVVVALLQQVQGQALGAEQTHLSPVEWVETQLAEAGAHTGATQLAALQHVPAEDGAQLKVCVCAPTLCTCAVGCRVRRSHHRTRRKSGVPERLASRFPLLETASETYSSSAPPARGHTGERGRSAYTAARLRTFESG